MVKIFDHWDDLSDGDRVDVVTHSRRLYRGEFSGFRRRKSNVGLEYQCVVWAGRGQVWISRQRQ